MVKIAVVSYLAVAEAGKLAVTWSDCGAKHAKVTDLQPTSVTTGKTEALVGSGTVDEDVTKAKFTATIKAAGATLATCSGDGTTDIECKLPLGAGVVTVKALTFPIQKGAVKIPVTVKTSSFLPPSLAKVDVHIAATDQNGEDVVCLDVHTTKAMDLEEVEVEQSVELWDLFKAAHDKTYPHPEEEARRFDIFRGNLAEIERLNAKNLSFTAGVNKFADLAPAEFSAILASAMTTLPTTSVAGGCAALRSAVDSGAVTVPVEKDEAFQFYSSGIIPYKACTKANYQLSAEKYSGSCGDSRAYWRLKNSLGPSWGEGGYVRLQMDDNSQGNRCIYTASSFAVAV